MEKIQNAIQELTANLDLATSASASASASAASLNRNSQPQPATYLASSSRDETPRVSSSTSANRNSNLITELAVNVNIFRSEIKQNLTKIYIDPRDKGKVYMLVSDNAAIFKIPSENGKPLELDECWCDEGLSRDNQYNITYIPRP